MYHIKVVYKSSDYVKSKLQTQIFSKIIDVFENLFLDHLNFEVITKRKEKNIKKIPFFKIVMVLLNQHTDIFILYFVPTRIFISEFIILKIK